MAGQRVSESLGVKEFAKSLTEICPHVVVSLLDRVDEFRPPINDGYHVFDTQYKLSKARMLAILASCRLMS